MEKEFKPREIKLSDVPISDHVRNGMTLKIEDHQFLVRLLNLHMDVTLENMAEIVIAQNKRMFEMFDELKKSIDILNVSIDELRLCNKQFRERLDADEQILSNHEKRIQDLEKRLLR
jgi:hypothetical protein